MVGTGVYNRRPMTDPHNAIPQSACEWPLATAEETADLGSALAIGARAGLRLYLSGELGAGKTTLTRGLLGALGHTGRVKSPTYTLVELYTLSSLNLYHFDFYRFADRSEWISSGFREYFNPQSLCIVEWPERAGDLLAPADIHLTLVVTPPGRRAVVTPRSPAGREWAAAALQRLRSSR